MPNRALILTCLSIITMVSSAYSREQALLSPNAHLVVQYCPPYQILKKPKGQLIWHVGKQWTSYQKSFSDKVVRFLGAQWEGIRIGQVICSYQGNVKLSFPIPLVYNVLSREPTGKHWSKNLGGYRNCISHKRADCPFLVAKKPKAESELDVAKSLYKAPPSQRAF